MLVGAAIVPVRHKRIEKRNTVPRVKFTREYIFHCFVHGVHPFQAVAHILQITTKERAVDVYVRIEAFAFAVHHIFKWFAVHDAK